MTPTYSYTLGIDLGITSIGTFLVFTDPSKVKNPLLDAGVRIFPESLGASTRRSKRQERKTLRRRKERIQKLTHVLKDNGLFPLSKDDATKLITFSPYKLRAKGVYEPLTLHELGRCLIHIAKLRGAGFITQLSELTEQDENEPTNSKKRKSSANPYKIIAEIINKEKITLSEFFLTRLPKKGRLESQPIRRRKRFLDLKRIDYAVPRYLVKDEFSKIMETQAKHHTILTYDLIEKIEKTIFTDKPHAPYANAYCSVLGKRGGYRLPRLHPLSEERRIYEEVNNIRFETNQQKRSLSKEMRDALIGVLMSGENLTKQRIINTLLPYFGKIIDNIDFNTEKKVKDIKAHAVVVAFKDIACWQEFSFEKQNEILDFVAEPRINKDDEYSVLFSDDEFLQELMKYFDFHTKEEEFLLAKAINKLPKSRGNLGKKATRGVLEYLKKGIEQEGAWKALSHAEALKLAGFNSHYENLKETTNTEKNLPYYGQVLSQDVQPVHPWHKHLACEEEAQYGRIANPVVHVALNQLRKVVNEIIKLYGKPQEIRIELARDLGNSAKKREEILNQQKANTKLNDDAAQTLIKHGIKVSGRNITKYKLWKEQDGKDIFTQQNISISDFESCEIDHLIERGLGINSYSNLALIYANTDLAKGTTFPSDFIAQNHPEKYSKIKEIIESDGYPKRKAWRFSEEATEHYKTFGEAGEANIHDGEDLPSGSALNDTRYIARIARKYLYSICEQVNPVQGRVTAKLRHLWGLDGLEYDLMEYNTNTLTNTETGESFKRAKPRLDHRHHALDAFVVANTSISMMQKFAKASRGNRGKVTLEDIGIPLGYENSASLRQALIEKLKEIKVSIKANHALNGELHNSTKVAIIPPHEENSHIPYPTGEGASLIYYNRAISKVIPKDINSKEDIKKIYSEAIFKYMDHPKVKEFHEKIQNITFSIESQFDEAEEVLKSENLKLQEEGKKPKELGIKQISMRAMLLAQEKGLIGTSYPYVDVMRLAYRTKHYGYRPDNNHRMDFYVNAKQEISWECITRYNANQKHFIPECKKDGNKLLWSLHIDDIFEMYVKEEKFIQTLRLPRAGRYLFRVQTLSKDRIEFYLASSAYANKSELNSDNLARAKSGEKRLSALTQGEARKITLSPFGKVIHKHKKLWHGKKKV